MRQHGEIFANGVKKWLAQVNTDGKATSEKDHGLALNQSPQSDLVATVRQGGRSEFAPLEDDPSHDHLIHARLFKEVTSGTVSNTALQHFLFQFEELYLRLNPMKMSGRVIPWVQSSGYGKTYTAFSLGKLMPCFMITLGPGAGDASVLPKPDDSIIEWLSENKEVATPKVVLATLVGSIYKHLFSYCVKNLSDREVQVIVPDNYSPARARDYVDDALRRVKQYAKYATATELIGLLYDLNTTPRGQDITVRNSFIEQVLKEASLLLECASIDEEEDGEYLKTLYVEHSVTTFMTLVVLTKDSVNVRLSQNINKNVQSYDQHAPRSMQSVLVIDNCTYLNQILFPKEQTSKGVHAIRGVYNDLLSLSKKEARLDEEDSPSLPSESSLPPQTSRMTAPITETDVVLHERPFDRAWLVLVDRDIFEPMEAEGCDYPTYLAFGRDHTLDLRRTHSKTVKELHSITGHLKNHGRGTWSRFQSMDVLAFAASKLCGNKGQSHDEEISPEQMEGEGFYVDKPMDRNADMDPLLFAIASYIFGLDDGFVGQASTYGDAPEDITSEGASNIYSTQVAGYMRTVLGPGCARTLPEPMLSIAAMMMVVYGADVLGRDVNTTYKKHGRGKAHLLKISDRLANANYDSKRKINQFVARTTLTCAMIDCFPKEHCPAKNSQAYYTTVEEFLFALCGSDVGKVYLEKARDVEEEEQGSDDTRDVGKGIINFHQWVPLRKPQDVTGTSKDRKEVDLGIDLLHVMFQRLCAIILDDDGKEEKSGEVSLIIPVLYPPKGIDKGSTSFEDLPYSQCEMRYIAISPGYTHLKDVVQFPLTLGRPLFSISMDVANQDTFEKDIDEIEKARANWASWPTSTTFSDDNQATVAAASHDEEIPRQEEEQVFPDSEQALVPDAVWDGENFQNFREIKGHRRNTKERFILLVSGLSTKVYPCLNVNSIGVNSDFILKGFQIGFRIKEFIEDQADTFSNGALVEQWKEHMKSVRAQSNEQEEEEKFEDDTGK